MSVRPKPVPPVEWEPRGASGYLPIKAVEWVVGPSDDFQNAVREVRVKTRIQRDRSVKYAVVMDGWTANHDGEWEHEPIPSSRDCSYICRCRWDDWEAAALMANRMALKLAREWRERWLR